MEMQMDEIVLTFMNPEVMTNENAMLLNGVLGLCGEAGEVADIIKKYLYQEHGIDVEKLATELGDVYFYLHLCLLAIGHNVKDIEELVFAKLSKRYGDRFSSEKSINRKEE